MKKKYGASFVISYIILAVFGCFMATLIGAQSFEHEVFLYMLMIQTMGAFIIGAIYLFGDNRENSEEIPVHKDAETEK